MVGQTGQGNNQENRARPGNRRLAQWTRDYARLPGIPDEYIGPDGAPRAVWTRFFDAFATLAPAYRNEGTAVFSLIRNIGSSIGISLVTTMLTRNTQVMQTVARDHRSDGSSCGATIGHSRS